MKSTGVLNSTRNYLLSILFVISTSHFSFSQGWLPVGARAHSLSNASVAISDAWAYFHNPGALADIRKTAVGIAYENRFLLKELQSQGFTYVQPIKKGVLSVGAHSFGYTTFRTFRGGFGYSMKLSERFMAGVQLNYQSLRIADSYGKKETITAEVGILCLLSDKWRLGMSIFNLNRAKLSEYRDDRFSTVMRLGSSYAFSEKFNVAVEAEKHIDYRLNMKLGLEYAFTQQVCFRAGMATAPVEISFGFGYKLKALQLDFGSAYHQQLGWSPHIGLTFGGTR
jgi:hypothetical protein